jgi:7-cyano-7-deazaguanine synthase in queuosine biosynthesis
MTGNPKSETILLMFSGGIDSTYLLHHYLRDTNHPVHAHHVSVRYPHWQRWPGEDPASESIVAWCKQNLRDFEYSKSRFDLDFPDVGWDSDLQLLVASKVALNLKDRRITVALGWCAEDLQRAQVRDRQERNVTTDLWRALRQSVVSADLNEEIAMPIVERGLSKAEIIAELPKELVALAWTCRSPRFADDIPHPCGTCHACMLRSSAMSEAAELTQG